ncbi:MAG: hypothetical protein IJ274_01580 [Lachnospiraceae bacterium]|nr:hypothetical protein [Lachnospiraceae bacterium]
MKNAYKHQLNNILNLHSNTLIGSFGVHENGPELYRPLLRLLLHKRV